jgi:hypothetical protein
MQPLIETQYHLVLKPNFKGYIFDTPYDRLVTAVELLFTGTVPGQRPSDKGAYNSSNYKALCQDWSIVMARLNAAHPNLPRVHMTMYADGPTDIGPEWGSSLLDALWPLGSPYMVPHMKAGTLMSPVYRKNFELTLPELMTSLAFYTDIGCVPNDGEMQIACKSTKLMLPLVRR